MQTNFITVADSGSNQVSFRLDVEQVTPTQTKTTQFTDTGIPVASYVIEGNSMINVTTIGDIDLMPTDNAFVKKWWACANAHYGLMMGWIHGDNELHDIAGANNGLSNIPYITETQVALASAIHCIKTKH
jgi:hypothetical protein